MCLLNRQIRPKIPLIYFPVNCRLLTELQYWMEGLIFFAQISPWCGKSLPWILFCLISQSTIPLGHHMMPLSTLSFTPFSDSPLLPWNESMSRLNDGTNIVCLPYTLSPLEFAGTLTECLIPNRASHSGKPRFFSVGHTQIFSFQFDLRCDLASYWSNISYLIPIIPGTI